MLAAGALVLPWPWEARPPRAQVDRPARPAEAPLGWRQIGRDARYVFGRPFHLDRSGWTRVGWVMGGGAALYVARQDVREFAQDHRGGFDSVLDGARDVLGKGLTVPLVALGYYLAGRARRSGYDTETAHILLQSVTYSVVVATAGNVVLAAERPRDGDALRFFASGGHGVSGDVSIASSLIAPIADRHLRLRSGDGRALRFWKRLGTWGLYGGAALVAYQRLSEDAHWVPDVFLGYANGLTIGRLLVDSHRGGRAWRAAPRRAEVTWTPGGVRIVWGTPR
ncbi:MAG: hypothetical protein ACE5JH_04650 [Acidobacteriota bacterium]